MTAREILYKGASTHLWCVSPRCSAARASRLRRGRRGSQSPSGDPSPSPEDVALTRRLVDAGKLLEIDVLDHLVIGDNRFVSLRERALGFESA